LLTTRRDEREDNRGIVRAIAFHLPQFHPIPENDEWWGKGFTEWTNVAAAKPRFPGHFQPHLPADLGFYDLRLPEVRAAQAELAATYGIHGFCYYHYWFNGRQVLERPVNEILKNGEPDFPFCLCWANENWTRRWDGMNDEVLLAQHYNVDDDLAHIRALIPFFLDPRYIRVMDRPFFAVYRASELPEPQRTTDIWRREAERAGLKGLFLVRVESHAEAGDPRSIGFDYSLEFEPRGSMMWDLRSFHRKWWHKHKLGLGEAAFRDNYVVEYANVVRHALAQPMPSYPRIPCVCPGWDNSARRKSAAFIIVDSTPDLYERWLRETVARRHAVIAPDGNSGMSPESLVFINAWNEWGEANHLEPCQRWGRGYLEATQRVLGVGRRTEPIGKETRGSYPTREIELSSAKAAVHLVPVSGRSSQPDPQAAPSDVRVQLCSEESTPTLTIANEHEAEPGTIRAIALHLPQFHPIPENDQWWGKGFTEWTNVLKAQPFFPGHYQPHVPADLGFYDLRLPEVRAAQAELAARYGIYGFCYYHYWFNGHQVLERPVNEIFKSGEPDFPFCLCWANHNWTRRWDGLDDDILLEQRYSAADDLEHIRSLLPFFLDRRYIRIADRPFFAVHCASKLPEPRRTTDLWRREAERAGLKGLFLVSVERDTESTDPRDLGFDYGLEWHPRGWILGDSRVFRRKWWHRQRLGTGEATFRDNFIFEYRDLVERAVAEAPPPHPRIPCVCPGWDNSPRRKTGAFIFAGSTPELYEGWLRQIVRQQNARLALNGNSGISPESLIFINAWNEWAEGTHLEPCKKWGHAYLEATRRALDG
jgi:lipopolysaccharide biosynthesis protein